MAMSGSDALAAVRDHAHVLRGSAADFDPLMELIGDASIVLLGEATHGSHEFYRARAELTQRLIVEKGFNAVAVEADWPDAYRLNRYVRGQGSDFSAEAALADFQRFPLWMWRNTEVEQFIAWLHSHNQGRAPREQAGFYGLDMYSLYSSIGHVIDYLEAVEPEAAARARQRYACFDQVGEEPQSYGYGVRLGARPACEREALVQLEEMRQRAERDLRRDGLLSEDAAFAAEQNARLVRNAETYYRGMFESHANTWNLRDQHMSDTVDALMQHLGRHGDRPRIVVWEHNSHIGDARATEMSLRGEHNVGQLVRQQYGEQAVLIGFTTYAGTVSAASDWDGPVERKRVRPALSDSVEALFHQTGLHEFVLPLRNTAAGEALAEPRLERAIGVLYLPQSERVSHYFNAELSGQFDAVVHYDHTRALQPLDMTAGWRTGEAPETYPFGL